MDAPRTTDLESRSPTELLGLAMIAAGGFALFVFEVIQFNDWWGFWGVAAAVIFPPLALAFPFVYWVLEEFDPLYLGLLLLMVAGFGVLVVGDMREMERSR